MTGNGKAADSDVRHDCDWSRCLSRPITGLRYGCVALGNPHLYKPTGTFNTPGIHGCFHRKCNYALRTLSGKKMWATTTCFALDVGDVYLASCPHYLDCTRYLNRAQEFVFIRLFS